MLALSFSGETTEIVELLPAVESRGGQVIAVTAHGGLHTGTQADVVVLLGDVQEADPTTLCRRRPPR